MADPQAEEIKKLKQIAEIKFDRERHRLAAVKDELTRLEDERRTLRQEIAGIEEAKETDPASLINAQAYLGALSGKAKRLDAERRIASERTNAQREKIKKALAAKIRIEDLSGGK